MARTHLTKNQISYPWNDAYATANKAKIDEHDHALDALEAGTTATVVTIHPVDGASTGDVANLAAFTVNNDGVVHTAGKRILLKDQTTVEQNGIYVVGTVGSGTAPLTRATDWDETAEVKVNSLVAVAAGTAGKNTLWQITGDFPMTVGTTHQHFAQIFNSDQLAATTSAAGATKIGVYDTGTYYTGTTVEAVLAEIYARLVATDATGLASVQGIRDTATQITATTVEGALAEIVPKTIQKRTATIAEGDLSGTSQAVNIGAALPANAIVLGHEIVVNTQGVLAGNDLSIIVGGTDTDAIVASTDLDALAPGKYQGTLGTHPRGSFASEQLTATFAASDLASLSAGNWTINVWYFVLA